MNTNVMFSSKSGKWDTPDDLVSDLSQYFDWDLDVCASGPNVCSNYFTEADDGLAQDWDGLCWMNPPYGHQIWRWVKKAAISKAHGATTVCLVPARTDTAWWQDIARVADYAVLIRGRLTFGSWASWVQRRNDAIWALMSENGEVDNATKLARAVNAVGGQWCDQHVAGIVYQNWGSMKNARTAKGRAVLRYADFDAWCRDDRLRRDAAPFPSAFLVYGRLTWEQDMALSKYGYSLH